MTPADKSIGDIIKRLQNIAKRNHDEFAYRIELEMTRGGELVYWFKCIETADRHTFVDGFGTTIEEAIIGANANITEACEHWGYNE